MESISGLWDADASSGSIAIEPDPRPMLGLPISGGLPVIADLMASVHPDDIAGLSCSVGNILSRKSLVLVTAFRLKHTEGHWVWIEATGRLNARTKKLSGVWTDISHRMESTARKDEAVSRVHQFAAAASHDLIGPLRHIAMYGDLLISSFGTGATEEERQMLVAIAEKARQLQVLTKRLIAFSTGTSAPEFRAVALDETMQQVSTAVADRLKDSNATLTWDELPEVTGDPVLIEKVIANLVENALDWPGGRVPEIRIEARQAGRNAVIDVADNGAGIDPRYSGRIFDAFWSMPGGRDGRKGAGLGLAVCKTILHALEGDIVLKNSSPEGSVFTVTLPLSR